MPSDNRHSSAFCAEGSCRIKGLRLQVIEAKSANDVEQALDGRKGPRRSTALPLSRTRPCSSLWTASSNRWFIKRLE